MRGEPEILDMLNEVLTGELTAVNQYFVHAKMQQNWGLCRLGDHTREESLDEMRHAEVLIERILYLEGVPNLQRLGALTVGETPSEQLSLDLALERAALDRLRNGIALALAKGDHGSRELLEQILVSEEKHIDWLETQLDLIGRVGEAHYFAHQVHGS